MNVAELKLEIIAKIIATDDVALLNKIQEAIDDYGLILTANEPPIIYEKTRVFSDVKAQKEIQESLEKVHIFTTEQRKRVLNSLEQSKTGNTMTDEEAQADIQKWL